VTHAHRLGELRADRMENGQAVETWTWSQKPYEFEDLLST
jgi:hypothetical protein